ncbi:NACHT domain-containing protein [Nonomuraea rhodomycinica]|uniref:NACHT N-terminal Helical domain-containing protein n=1 Tax=Nonomuraea rhodomycinica TaxID=1712872 RepID=A0A7Y6IIU7_9ACTN|nr:hypothetical protein [Nonomuraea rhodomycinica]NUW38922.1 hypothetical protein [Nonomuraea rhodomycinica]
MTDTLSYADALKILGCNENRLFKVAEFAATAGLTGWALAGGAQTALSLFDLKNDVVRYGEDVLRRVSGWRTGVNRFTRTQRLAAAHAVVVVSAYFRALDESELPFDLRRLRLDRGVQSALAAGGAPADGFAELMERLLAARLPMPEPHRPYAETRRAVGAVYRRMSEAVARYVRGLALWDELAVDDRIRLPALLAEGPPERALRRYDDDYRLLALDSPEFGVWSLVTETQALGAGLSRVARLLAELAPPRAGDRPRVHLLRLAASALDQPLMAAGKVPDGIALPLLGEGYINPRCRVAEMTREARPAVRGWWEGQAELPDAEAFLVGHLTSLRATQAPLVVLGEPGSGKSKLTEVLAARLASSEFLPIRVALRDVAAESTVTSQIEQGLAVVLDEEVKYQDLLESAEGALPVVVLDGFDELIQAAGTARYDYLEQIQEFQARQARLGRPVAVVVTSRTVVADRVRFPRGVLAVELMPFDDDQVRAWLDIWDQTNRALLARHALKPLPAAVALAQGEPARLPLLLLLLALYDATGNALQRGGGELGRAQLYESLIKDFATREVLREPGVRALPAARQRRLVERELVRLGAVALSMFARGRPVVAESALNRDLPALCGTGEQVEDASVNWAQQVTGRFFFVHQNQARPADDRARSYEFLHATFGEFLVAWLAVYAVRDLVRRHALAEDELTGPPDDDLLYAITSFSCLAERAPVVGFATELLRALPGPERSRAAEALAELVRGALYERKRRLFTEFVPVRHPLTRRLAAYSANLVLLLVAVSPETVSVRELLGDEDDFASWRSHAHLWKGQLERGGWPGLMRALRASRRADDIELGGMPESGRDVTAWWFGEFDRPPALLPVHTSREERPYFLDLAADLMGEEEEAALVQSDGRLRPLSLVVRDLFLHDGSGSVERVALYEDLASVWNELPQPGFHLDVLIRALTLDTGLPFDERARIVTALAGTGAGDHRLRPLVESMIFERTDSLDLLAAAGVPGDLLRDPNRP